MTSTLLCALMLAGCAGLGKKKAADEPTGGRMKSMDSFGSESIKRGEEKKLSPLDQKVFTASKAFSGSKTEFKTKAFSGDKTFHSGKDEFKTNAFALGNKESRDGTKLFHSGKGDNPMGGKTFATKENALGSKQSSEGSRMFSGNNAKYYSKDNYEAQKAVRESRKPLITGDQPSISEDQLQRLLNKN